MARVIFHPEQTPFTDGLRETDIAAGSCRELITELSRLYSGLSEAELSNYMVSIDGVVINNPFLEKLNPESEFVFIRKIAAG